MTPSEIRFDEPGSSQRVRLARTIAAALFATALVPTVIGAEPATLAAARQRWENRAQGFDGEWASAQPIAEAVESYELALEDDPDNLEIHRELLRALYFQGSFTDLEDQERALIFAHGTEVADRAVEVVHGAGRLEWKKREKLVEEARQHDGAGEVHFWAAMHWGQWGDLHGPMAALRQGVAARLRVHGQLAIELAPDYEEAGPYRFLGRMHSEAPKVPMFTGWINRETAVTLLEEAFERAPLHPDNRLFLAEIWLERRPDKADEAHAILSSLTKTEPRPGHEVEDSFSLKAAAESLGPATP